MHFKRTKDIIKNLDIGTDRSETKIDSDYDEYVKKLAEEGSKWITEIINAEILDKCIKLNSDPSVNGV